MQLAPPFDEYVPTSSHLKEQFAATQMVFDVANTGRVSISVHISAEDGFFFKANVYEIMNLDQRTVCLTLSVTNTRLFQLNGEEKGA